MKITFLRTYEDSVPSDFVETICSENSTNSSLPTAWFQEVNDEILVSDFERYEKYCLVIFIYAIIFAALRKWWSIMEGGQVRALIPLATSILLPSDNWNERIEAITEHMISKVRAPKNYFLYLVYVEFACLLLGLIGIFYPGSSFQNQNLEVHLNGSEWTVDCDSQGKSRTIFTLTQCQYNYSDGTFRNLCIVPSDNAYVYLYAGSAPLFGMLAFIGFTGVLCGIVQIRTYGLLRMRDGMLLIMLAKNVDYEKHMSVIDAFELKLDERRIEAMMPIEPPPAKYERAYNFMLIFGMFGIQNWSWEQWWRHRNNDDIQMPV
ncbi:unnamed protein product [Larinioides sclopetarius]